MNDAEMAIPLNEKSCPQSVFSLLQNEGVLNGILEEDLVRVSDGPCDPSLACRSECQHPCSHICCGVYFIAMIQGQGFPQVAIVTEYSRWVWAYQAQKKYVHYRAIVNSLRQD